MTDVDVPHGTRRIVTIVAVVAEFAIAMVLTLASHPDGWARPALMVGLSAFGGGLVLLGSWQSDRRAVGMGAIMFAIKAALLAVELSWQAAAPTLVSLVCVWLSLSMRVSPMQEEG